MILSRSLRATRLGLILLAPAPAVLWAADAPPTWKQVEKKGNATLYEKDRAGTSIKEVRAVGTFDSPNWVVRNVLDDTENYTKFMPYVIESRILARDPSKHALITYAEINPPLVSKRDYTIVITDESRKGPGEDEMTYFTRWRDAHEKGPAEKSGVVRVKNNDGSWLLEPIDGGKRTKATYTLFTDGGGGIPTFLLNSLNKKRLVELFEIVEKQAKKSQYQQNKPVLP